MPLAHDGKSRPKLSPWTPQIIEQLRELWFGGVSASECARLLGINVSRNAVISAVNRRGWRRSPQAQEATFKLANAGRKARAPKAKPVDVTPAVPQPVAPVARSKPAAPRPEPRQLVASVGYGQCCYETKPGLYCGEPTEIRRGRRASYCDKCHSRIFVKGGRL